MDDALLEQADQQNEAESPQEPSLGDRLIALGQALNNPETTLEQLTRLAIAAGQIAVVRVVPNETVDYTVDVEQAE